MLFPAAAPALLYSFSAPGLFNRHPYAVQIREIQPDEKGLADDLVVRNESPITAVTAVVAIVAHHEVLPCRHLAAHHFIVITAILAPAELGYRTQMQRWHLRIDQHGVFVLTQCFETSFSMHKVQAGLNVIVIPICLLRLFDPVDPQPLVAIFDSIAGKSDHALDIIQRRIFRVAEHHHIPALRIVKLSDLLIDDRQPHAICKFIHQNKVADLQSRDHRAGRYLERLDQEKTNEKYHQNDRKETLGIFHPPWLDNPAAALGRQGEAIQQPNAAGNQQQHEHNQCKIHRYSLTLIVHAQDRQEGFLRNLYTTHLLHAFLAGFLFFQQFFLA